MQKDTDRLSPSSEEYLEIIDSSEDEDSEEKENVNTNQNSPEELEIEEEVEEEEVETRDRGDSDMEMEYPSGRSVRELVRIRYGNGGRTPPQRRWYSDDEPGPSNRRRYSFTELMPEEEEEPGPSNRRRYPFSELMPEKEEPGPSNRHHGSSPQEDQPSRPKRRRSSCSPPSTFGLNGNGPSRPRTPVKSPSISPPLLSHYTTPSRNRNPASSGSEDVGQENHPQQARNPQEQRPSSVPSTSAAASRPLAVRNGRRATFGTSRSAAARPTANRPGRGGSSIDPNCIPGGMAPDRNDKKRKSSGPPRKDPKKPKREPGEPGGPEDPADPEPANNDPHANYYERPSIMVLKSDLNVPKVLEDRILFVRLFNIDHFPTECDEAKMGKKYGEWTRKPEVGSWPGVPNKKFSYDQYKRQEYMEDDKDWQVQATFEAREPNKFLIYYEGWTSECMLLNVRDKVQPSAPEVFDEMEVRLQFQTLMREQNKLAAGFDEENVQSKVPDNMFWLYMDLSYFHTMMHKEQGLAQIWYMHALKTRLPPPKFVYTAINILNYDSYRVCRQRRASKPWEMLLDGGMVLGKKGYQGSCEAGMSCVCDARYTLLYGEQNGYNGHRFSKNIVPNSEGLIDVKSFEISDARIIMECSDECQCTEKCPRRQLQRGQSKPLVVFYENAFKGFGVRAAADFKAGEFVCEYTGIARCSKIVEFDKDDHAFKFAVVPASPSEKKQPAKEVKSDVPPISEAETKINEKVAKLMDGKKELNHEDMSYEAGFNLMDTSMVISANWVGNIARFINHSCDSNTAFMEVFSRKREEDVLVPRIAVYAIKDIEMGEEVTTNYYGNHDGGKKSTIRCHCKAANCKKYLPEVRSK